MLKLRPVIQVLNRFVALCSQVDPEGTCRFTAFAQSSVEETRPLIIAGVPDQPAAWLPSGSVSW